MTAPHDDTAVDYRSIIAQLRAERDAAEAREAAFAEVIDLINRGPEVTAAVFETILKHAHVLCDTVIGSLWHYDGAHLRLLTTRGFPPDIDALLRQEARTPTSGQQALIDGARFFNTPDMTPYAASPENEEMRKFIEGTGVRTGVMVPLRKQRRLLGILAGWRLEPRPFSELEITILERFAAQAVIAIENARLLGDLQHRTDDLQKSLDYQSATSDLLKIISRSTFDLDPVFEAVVSTAARLCWAEQAVLFLRQDSIYRWAASFSTTLEYDEIERAAIIHPGSGTIVGRAALARQPVQILDAWTDPHYVAKDDARVGGVRTMLGVPLMRGGEPIGVIGLARRNVEPYTDAQVQLVGTFADQAVIAMENARLLNEQREALEQQTATAEVLQTINSNPGNLSPVFDALLDNALRLCGGTMGGIFMFRQGHSVTASLRGVTPEFVEYNARQSSDEIRSGSVPARIIETKAPVQRPDITSGGAYGSGYPYARALVELGGIRSVLAVPLLRENAAVGMIAVYRQRAGLFAEKQVSLLENFASQAVIAMENARLLTEQREALEQQTATAEVLHVINTNPGNLVPVFDAILEKAHTLCGATIGSLVIYDGVNCHAAAMKGYSAAYAKVVQQNQAPSVRARRLIDGADFVHVLDMKAEEVDSTHAVDRSRSLLTDIRTALFVPLRKDRALLGFISAYRLHVQAFSDKEIGLLKNFAAQAVIAMENARLLTEQREALERQTATTEVLQAINASPGDLQPVFDMMLESAMRLCEAAFGILSTYDGVRFHTAATRGVPKAFAEYRRYNPPDYGPDTGPGRVVAGERQVHILDLKAEDAYRRGEPNRRALVDLGGARTSLLIALRRDNQLLGFVQIYRQEVRAFSDKQISLLENFAGQAVVAMENARLIDELRTARDYAETALADLRVAQDRLIQTEKLASLGHLTAGIAHEIKNPLNFVNNFAALSVDLLDELKKTAAPAFATLDNDARTDVADLTETLTGNLRKIEEHGKRADSIVRSMLEHSRASSGERRVVDLNALVDEALNLAYHGARAQDQSFTINAQRDLDPQLLPIEVSPQDITRVLLNLFSNGFYAVTKRARGGEAGFEPQLTVTTRAAADGIEIRVRDNGVGIPPDIRDKLFQPFFTTKPTGEGTGLGLSISYDIITKAHGGTIAVDSEEGAFTEFVVGLPCGTSGNAL